jgi:hypothetical protein
MAVRAVLQRCFSVLVITLLSLSVYHQAFSALRTASAALSRQGVQLPPVAFWSSSSAVR